MPGGDNAPYNHYDVIALLGFIFQGDPGADKGLERLTRHNYLPVLPYLPADPGRRERLIRALTDDTTAAAAE